jgi:uncharacterized protein
MLEEFENQKYINLETFRKSGAGVKTPVWFVQDRDVFYVWTQADSGKAKRIRNNGAVKVAPSTASGEQLGEWVDAHATTNESPEALTFTTGLMRKKYGAAFQGFRLMGKLNKAEYMSIKLKFSE